MAIRPSLDLELVWKAGHQPKKAIDPELFELLEEIKNTGKLTQATKRVEMHYRQAWGLITLWSERLGQPLVSKKQGSGTTLTELGERLLWIRERAEYEGIGSGFDLLIWVFLVVWATDIGAYFSGRAIGGAQGSPRAPSRASRAPRTRPRGVSAGVAAARRGR